MATNLGELLRERARQHPDRVFLWCADDRMTYAETDARADRVAAGFSEAGVAPGDRVAVISSNRMEMLETFFGLARLGAVQVPLNVFLKGEFLRYQLHDSEASTLVVDGPAFESAQTVIRDIPEAKRVIAYDDAGEALRGVDVMPYARIRESKASVPPVTISPQSLLSIMYTARPACRRGACSGTAGTCTRRPSPRT